MPDRALLLSRLESLSQALQASGDGMGLLALGSVGLETDRLDRWSDLDFFLIVRPGTKVRYLGDPGWFSRVAPVSWVFRNTADGYKVLFTDGVFAEMAWFEPRELESIPYSPGRWVWKSLDLDPGLSRPRNPGSPAWKPESADWAMGELLSCLYVGLGRWHRGERLSAWRFVQDHAVNRFLELVDHTAPSQAPGEDYYNRDRRWEARHPELASVLATFLPGYESTPGACLALLRWCEDRFPVPEALAAEVRRLAGAEEPTADHG
jgi:hypothetical protein